MRMKRCAPPPPISGACASIAGPAGEGFGCSVRLHRLSTVLLSCQARCLLLSGLHSPGAAESLQISRDLCWHDSQRRNSPLRPHTS